MKKLYIMRHGDSPMINGVADFDRPLSEMGRYDAINIGLHLNENFPLPTCIISSAANRALTTARIVGGELEFDTTKIKALKELHNAPMNKVFDELLKISSDVDCAMVFGHNPGLSELATYLTAENFNLNTCNLVLLSTEIEDWQELSKGNCTVETFIAP